MSSRTTRRIAKEIRAARAYAGMSREQLGAAVDLDEETIGRYERGEWKRLPKAPILAAIATATGIPDAYRQAGFLGPPGAGDLNEVLEAGVRDLTDAADSRADDDENDDTTGQRDASEG